MMVCVVCKQEIARCTYSAFGWKEFRGEDYCRDCQIACAEVALRHVMTGLEMVREFAPWLLDGNEGCEKS